MAQLPEKVLAWLYSVLHDYQDPQRTYSDAVRALSSHPTLSPRTEVFTYENGIPALLLTLSGTLPVGFRGTTYRFPVKLWIPRSYPQDSPMTFVIPGKDMVVRPGQHVGVDGRVYHPYLRDWPQMWDRASIAEFLGFLQQVFAKEPPVISKVQQEQYQRPIGQSPVQAQGQVAQRSGPTPPQLPPKQTIGAYDALREDAGPRPRPPKILESQAGSSPQHTLSRDLARDGPPLPPLPHEMSASERRPQPPLPPLPSQTQQQNNYRATTGPSPQAAQAFQQATYPGRRPVGEPLPPLTRYEEQHPSRPPLGREYENSPVSPLSPTNGISTFPEHQLRLSRGPNETQVPHPGAVKHPTGQYPHDGRHPPTGPNQYLHNPQRFQYSSPQTATQPRTQQTQDLLSDPFDIAISSPPANHPAPPIPPNPEKEHLLQALSRTLVQQAQQKIQQNLSAVAPLQVQQTALLMAHDRLKNEMKSLEALEAVLASNEAILHRSLIECDRTIEAAKTKPPPPVDEVLVAPTMVANQLWTLCAEEAACREAMYVLQKAIDRGRVSESDFVRQMRSLGRERFLKMALARKCARGLGLELGPL